MLMMHHSNKLLGGGEQGYFHVQRPVNARVNHSVHLAELFGRPRAADECPPSPWFRPSIRLPCGRGRPQCSHFLSVQAVGWPIRCSRWASLFQHTAPVALPPGHHSLHFPQHFSTFLPIPCSPG